MRCRPSFVSTLLLAGLLLSGCAGLAPETPRSTAEVVEAPAADEEPPAREVAEPAVATPTPTPPEPVVEQPAPVSSPPPAVVEPEREQERPPRFDIPIVRNREVKAWLDRYAYRDPASFEPGLVRSGRYLTMFRAIFAEAGIPRDLVYLAHVESAYKPHARSHAGAAGIFQFIAGTARAYGLRVDDWVDERADPEKSARAAAAYLRDLNAEFGDWYLAMAAYNAGAGTVRRAIARTGTRDFWKLARGGHLRRETRNYVPAILAVTLISKEPRKYGFRFRPEPPLVYDTVRVEGPADLRVIARCAGVDVEAMRALNPALRHDQTPADARTDVRVPPGVAEVALAALEKIPVEDRTVFALHRVRHGETLSSIARRHGSSVRAIQQANGMGQRTLIHPGATLKIPGAAAASHAAWHGEVGADGAVTHVVRAGDTLWSIARRYGTTPQRVAGDNGIAIDATLDIGQRLTVVPAPAAAPAGTVHTVRHGDTLWSIATLYRTTVDALCALNSISARDTLKPGTRLSVP